MIIQSVQELAENIDVSYDAAFHVIIGMAMGVALVSGFVNSLFCNFFFNCIVCLYSFLKKKFFKNDCK